MTYQYIQHFHTAKCFSFLRIVLWLKGGVYNKVGPQLLIFGILYTILSLCYRFLMSGSRKDMFERWVISVYNILDLVPVVLILGFYISVVFNRFWSYFLVLPWSQSPSIAIAAHLRGNSDLAKQMRRTLVRYMNLAFLIVSIQVNEPIQKEFKDLDALVDRKMLTSDEKRMMESVKTTQNRYFLPLLWSIGILKTARKKRLITSKHGFAALIKHFQYYYDLCRKMLVMDTVCLPLVYTQVVTVAVYTYALLCILGRQYIDPTSIHNETKTADFYVPVFTILELFIYLGCLKLTEELLNPMGFNVDDFDLFSVFNCSWKTSLYVTALQERGEPEIIKDIHFGRVGGIPHTAESLHFARGPVMGSMSYIETGSVTIPEADNVTHRHVREESETNV